VAVAVVHNELLLSSCH